MGMAAAIAAAVTTHMTTPILWRVIVSQAIQMLPVEEIYDGASGEEREVAQEKKCQE